MATRKLVKHDINLTITDLSKCVPDYCHTIVNTERTNITVRVSVSFVRAKQSFLRRKLTGEKIGRAHV